MRSESEDETAALLARVARKFATAEPAPQTRSIEIIRDAEIALVLIDSGRLAHGVELETLVRGAPSDLLLIHLPVELSLPVRFSAGMRNGARLDWLIDCRLWCSPDSGEAAIVPEDGTQLHVRIQQGRLVPRAGLPFGDRRQAEAGFRSADTAARFLRARRRQA